jgi:putative endonuclease
MYYVYFLLLKTNRVYTGFTDDLKRRMSEHKSGRVESTRKLSPALVGYESYLLKSDAQRRERFLKTTEGRRLFQKQYRDILLNRKSSPSHTTGRPVA